MRNALLLLAALLGGCGYAIVGSQTTHVPGDIHSVAVGTFTNRSRQEGLDKTLAFAVEREFYQRGALEIRESKGEGEAIISGTIREFKIRPVSFNQQDEALQYEAKLVLDVVLTRQSDGSVLWKGNNMQSVEDFSVNRQTVVPSSSQFQQGTLDFDNLAQLTDIQLAETEKHLAIDRMMRAIARDVHDRILDDF
ncbi:MAG: LPS assembly lipoprotein LptE [Deltaproteobacteria bacterium]|nr:LPS assembly lipoprotein LptE [Deltaproteobacteria bacterium]